MSTFDEMWETAKVVSTDLPRHNFDELWQSVPVPEQPVDYFKENWKQVAAERVQRAQEKRRLTGAPPLSAAEQTAIMDAYRMTAGQKPLVTGHDFYREAQIARRMGSDFYSRWLANSSAAIQAAIQPTLSLVGTIAPDLANNLQKDAIAQYGPDIQKRTFAGRAIGGVLGFTPAMLPVPGAAPAFFGATGIGGVRMETHARREAGQPVTFWDEWIAAIGTGVVNASIGGVSEFLVGSIASILSKNSTLLATALQHGGRELVHTTALRLLASYLPKVAWGAAGNAATLVAMTGIDNALARIYDPQRAITAGMGEAAIIGAGMAVGGAATRIARMLEELPAKQIMKEIPQALRREAIQAAERAKADREIKQQEEANKILQQRLTEGQEITAESDATLERVREDAGLPPLKPKVERTVSDVEANELISRYKQAVLLEKETRKDVYLGPDGSTHTHDAAIQEVQNARSALNSADNPLLAKFKKENVEVNLGAMKETSRPVKPSEAPALEDITSRVAVALKQAKKIRPIITEEQRIARAERVKEAAKAMEERVATGSAEEAIRASTGKLKGPLTEYESRYESVRGQFKSPEINALFESIAKNPDLQYFEKVDTQEALTGLLDGRALARYEIILLNNHFGRKLADVALARRPMSDKVWDIGLDVAGLPRTLLASIDMSGILRQARLLGQAHPRLYWEMIKRYHKSFFSEKYTEKLNQEMKDSPDYAEARQMGLDLTSYGSQAIDVLMREERFATRFAEKIPGVKQSERSYTSALNWMRLAAYSKLKQGMLEAGMPITSQKLQRIAQVINDLSGRSSLGKGIKSQRFAAALNTVFFAPRFQLSRMKVLVKLTVPTDPLVQAEVGKAVASFIGTNLVVMGLLKVALGDKAEMEFDPRSSDFGKIIIGNVHIEPWAGFVPLVRFAAQMTTGQIKTTAIHRITDVSRKDVLTRYLRGKESPIAALVTDVFTGKKYTGKELNWFNANLENEFYQRLTPLAIQDVIDTSVTDGWPAGLLVLPATFYGMGIQTYKPTEYQQAERFKERIAIENLGKSWDELSPVQQKQLRLKNPAIVDAERAAKFARTDYEFVGEIIEKEMAVGRNVENRLAPDIQQALESTGTSIGGLSRTFGQFRLNDRRYEQYQVLLAEQLNARLARRIRQKDWTAISDARKQTILEYIVRQSKDIARKRLLSEVTRGKR